MTALGTPNELTLCCRLGTAFAARYPGIGLAELESTFRALNNVSEFHVRLSCRLFIKITALSIVMVFCWYSW
jgi:hypothetical protein